MAISRLLLHRKGTRVSNIESSLCARIAQKKRIAWLAVALSTGAILLATLHPSGHTTAPGWSWALTSGDAALAEPRASPPTSQPSWVTIGRTLARERRGVIA
jgi:hypothetical protein